ncbi:hypothetical protein DUNSADRAFT_10526 [Dunaliella salina]|uniref:Uncharacterized protein n=1 Tax=Dunaliella salina TaxID=3046 RepID=A0ABQ7FTU6_DUNSA|nr:hypothetical protein DUNSADRAFT_10526 [Dunaliella salina]|eukprot:KAF5825402.1 hypothetical protein DUNSADRAFT_10526 [Dunaliella salina]
MIWGEFFFFVHSFCSLPCRLPCKEHPKNALSLQSILEFWICQLYHSLSQQFIKEGVPHSLKFVTCGSF